MPHKETVLVCVTAQPSAQTLLASAKKLAERKNADVLIFSVLPKRQASAPDWRALAQLQALSDQNDAQMRIVFHDSPIEAMKLIMEEENVTALVTGYPGKNSADFVRKAHTQFPLTTLYMVTTDGTAYSAVCVPKNSEDHIPSPVL